MKKITKAQRTQAIINQWKGLPGEFYMLKGLLCLEMAVQQAAPAGDYYGKKAQRDKVRELYDDMAIATRMDELNGLVVRQ